MDQALGVREGSGDRHRAGDVGRVERVQLDAGVHEDEIAGAHRTVVAHPVQGVGVLARRDDRVVADGVALGAGVHAEDSLEQPLAAAVGDRAVEVGDDVGEGVGADPAGLAQLAELPVVLDHAQLVGRGDQLVVGPRIGAAGPVDERGDRGVRLADDADRGVGALEECRQPVDALRAHAAQRRHLRRGLPGADPHLAVAGVGVELRVGARHARVEEQHALAVGLDDEHRVGLAVGAQPAEVREGRVRPIGEVAVVVASLEAACRDDEALAGKPRRQGRAVGRGAGYRRQPGRGLGGVGCPVRRDELLERLRVRRPAPGGVRPFPVHARLHGSERRFGQCRW